MMLETYRRELPITSIPFFSAQRTHDSEISRVVRQHGIEIQHDHDWLLIHGSGHSRFVTGKYHSVLNPMMDRDFANAMSILLDALPVEEKGALLRVLRSPTATEDFYEALYDAECIPPAGADEKQIAEWFAEHRDSMAAMVTGKNYLRAR
jgi:hypothetical protein